MHPKCLRNSAPKYIDIWIFFVCHCGLTLMQGLLWDIFEDIPVLICNFLTFSRAVPMGQVSNSLDLNNF